MVHRSPSHVFRIEHQLLLPEVSRRLRQSKPTDHPVSPQQVFHAGMLPSSVLFQIHYRCSAKLTVSQYPGWPAALCASCGPGEWQANITCSTSPSPWFDQQEDKNKGFEMCTISAPHGCTEGLFAQSLSGLIGSMCCPFPILSWLSWNWGD